METNIDAVVVVGAPVDLGAHAGLGLLAHAWDWLQTHVPLPINAAS